MRDFVDLETGRSQQKYRTRKALLAAARGLLERKQAVTVQSAADEAGISRASAYRYFTSAEYLMREALLDGNWESPESVIGEAQDVKDRVLRVQAYLFAFTRRNESAHRLFLAKALETWVEQGGEGKVQLRGARRLPMFELALKPLGTTLPPNRVAELVYALASVSGIEAYIAMKDVCGLEDADIDRIAARNACAILDQASKETNPSTTSGLQTSNSSTSSADRL
jgi:AcrR family transcriptional regulator